MGRGLLLGYSTPSSTSLPASKAVSIQNLPALLSRLALFSSSKFPVYTIEPEPSVLPPTSSHPPPLFFPHNGKERYLFSPPRPSLLLTSNLQLTLSSTHSKIPNNSRPPPKHGFNRLLPHAQTPTNASSVIND